MRIVTSTCPSADAEALARTLVEERLAACVQIVPGVRSVYRWQGELHVDDEVQLWIKTAVVRIPDLVDRLADLHPYEVPEILVVDVDEAASHGEYVDWVLASVDALAPPEEEEP